MGVTMGLLRRLAAVTAAALLPVAGLAGTTSAKGSGPPPNPLATGLVGPLSIAVTARGDVLVAQSFIGTISKVDKQGGVTDLVTEEAFTPGVADDGDVLYTSSGPAGVFLKSVAPDGTTSVVANILAHEINQNPDADQQYGFTEISDECAAEWPEEFFGPPQYTGIIDTNPYAIATTKDHIYIADAAANAILSVDALGDVTTVAVLPPQPAVVNQDAIDGLGLPQCTLGLTYNFEPVPTDVELHGGQLYVTTLPGGPEDPSAARAVVCGQSTREPAQPPRSGRASPGLPIWRYHRRGRCMSPSCSVGRSRWLAPPATQRLLYWMLPSRSSGPRGGSTSLPATQPRPRSTRWLQARSSPSGHDHTTRSGRPLTLPVALPTREDTPAQHIVVRDGQPASR